MIKNLILDLYNFSYPSQRRVYFILQLLIIFMSIMEVVSIGFLGLFVKILSDVDYIYVNKILSAIFIWLNISESLFIVYYGILLFITLFISSSLSIFTIWRVSLFASRFGTELGDRLFKNYLNQPLLFHTKSNSSLLTKKISIEVTRVTDKILTQLLLMNARIILILIIFIALIIFNPIVTIFGFAIFASSYIILFKAVSKKLVKNSRIFSDESSNRFKTLSEGLGGILDVIILNKKFEFFERFSSRGIPLFLAHGTNVALSMIPKFFMEFLIFGGFALIIVFLLILGEGNLIALLPTFTVYGIVGIKFLPAFQQIYNGLTQIKGNITAWEEIKADININDESINFRFENSTELSFNRGIFFDKVFFNYQEKSRNIIDNITLDIKVNNIVGIIGPSGSGKSTLVNLISGLILPSSGSIRVDDIKINSENVLSWQKNIGYVSQDVFLTDQSILENIAFGINKKDIDIDKVKSAIQQANLSEFIDIQPSGLDTIVGEKGVRISGGQMQRIAIARALYDNPDVILFDEATSSLDGISEKNIMETIANINVKLIVIIAHRLNTIKNCDNVILLNDGVITDQGSFKEIYKRQKIVREMENNEKDYNKH